MPSGKVGMANPCASCSERYPLDRACWRYGRIISESAGFGKRHYGFVMDRFKKLRSSGALGALKKGAFVLVEDRPCVIGDLGVDHRRAADILIVSYLSRS